MRRWLSENLVDLALVVGYAGVVVGLWLLLPALALVVGGLLLLLPGVRRYLR